MVTKSENEVVVAEVLAEHNHETFRRATGLTAGAGAPVGCLRESGLSSGRAGETAAMTGYTPGEENQPPPAGQGQYPPQQGPYPPQQGQYPPQPGPLPRQKVRPGRIWYLVPLAIFVAGAAWLIVGVVSLASTVNGLQRVPVPAGGTVNLSHSGGYTIYYEGPGAQSGNIPPFHINVTPASQGASVTSLTRYGSTVTYNIGSHHGRAVLTLQVARPGRFAVSAAGAQATGADLAFGGSIAHGIVGTVLPGVPLMILGFLSAVILLIIRIIRKRSLRQRYV